MKRLDIIIRSIKLYLFNHSNCCFLSSDFQIKEMEWLEEQKLQLVPSNNYKNNNSNYYTAAVERGYSPCHEFMDQAVSIPQPNGEPWSPQNSDGKFSGELMTMEHALATSTNSVSAQIVDIVKPANAAEMAERLGLQTRINPYHSMVLGTQEASTP